MKILILGLSPLPVENRTRMYAPGMRSFQFARPLAEEGHDVSLVCCRYGEAYTPDDPEVIQGETMGVPYFLLHETLFMQKGWLEDFCERTAPDCLAGITTVLAERALKLGNERPLWADLFGHFLAEGQAKAACYGDNTLLRNYYMSQIRVLDRSDAFSVVSAPQGMALVGELGLRGRLNSETSGFPFYSVIPIAFNECPLPTGPPAFRGKDVPEDAFVILWSGGYNTWTDAAFLFRVLEQVMAADPSVVFLSTGGQMQNQDEKTYPMFQKLVEGSPFKARYHLKGWLPLEEATGYYHWADVGINVDRDIYEVRLGSKNRILDWMRAGLPAVTTGLTELGETLGRENLCYLYHPGDEGGLVSLLLRLSTERDTLQGLRETIITFGKDYFSAARTTESFREWVKNPVRAPDAGTALSFEKNLAEELEKTVEECAVRQKHIDNLLAMGRDKDGRIAEQDDLIKKQQAFIDKIQNSLPYRGYAFFKRIARGGK